MADSETVPPIPLPAPGPSAPDAVRHRAFRYLAALFRFVWHRPVRALGLFALLVLLALTVGAGGLYFWFDHHLRAGRRAVEQGHVLPAVDHLRSCRRVFPDRPELLLLCARTARRGGSWSEAEDMLDRYWQQRGDDESLVLERLLLRATRGEIEPVRPLLEARIRRDEPGADLAREALAAGLLYRYRLPEAERVISAWVKHDPDSTLALMAQAKFYSQREQNSEALLVYRRVVEIDPRHDDARLRMTAILLQLRQGEEAVTHLKYLRHRHPHHADVLFRLGQAQELQGESDEARDLLDQCLRKYPDHPEALAERGRIAHRDGDADKAEALLRRAVQLDPGTASSRYQLYLVLIKNGNKVEAAKEQESIRNIEADVKRVKELILQLQVTPDDPAVHHEIALIALRAGRPKEALRWLLSAAQVGPDHAPTHRVLASLYREMGNPILASRHRAIAQRLDGDKQR